MDEKELNWEKQDSKLAPVWEYKNAGDTLIGVVKSIKKGKFIHNNYIILDNNNVEWMVWGAAILQSRMGNIKIGDFIKIVYLGITITANKMEAHNFEVFKAKAKQ